MPGLPRGRMAEAIRTLETAPRARAAYPHFLRIPTRWMDNDAYGHVNNVTYYSYFDTVVNEHLIRVGGHDIERARAIGVVVETGCTFAAFLAFPEVIDAGLAVTRLGGSSVTYAIGLFRENADAPAAAGRFVHVWIDRASQRPVAVPDHIRVALLPLVIDVAGSP